MEGNETIYTLDMKKVYQFVEKVKFGTGMSFVMKNYYSKEPASITEFPMNVEDGYNSTIYFLDLFENLYLSPKENFMKDAEESAKRIFNTYGLTNIQIAAICWADAYMIPSESKRIVVALSEYARAEHIAFFS